VAIDTHHAPQLTPEQVAPPASVDSMRRRWFGAAGIGILGSLGLLLLFFRAENGLQHFFRAYLVGFIMVTGLTMGCMALLSLYHVVGGKWGVPVMRIYEAGTRNWFLMVLAFLPIAFNLHHIYPWAGAQGLDLHQQHAVEVRGTYLSPQWFIIRQSLILLGWGVFIYFMNKWSHRLDVPAASEDAYNQQRLRFMRLGGGALVFWAATLEIASVDWVMSLDPLWFSTIWGMIYMVGEGLTALALMCIVLRYLAKSEPMHSFLRVRELHENGNLLLAFVMLFCYLSFSQFIIIWSGNLPEEIRYFLARTQGGWKPVMITLVLIHFAIPFLLLLNRGIKKHPNRLAAVALLIMVARFGEVYWQVNPMYADTSGMSGHFSPNLFDLVVPLTMVAIWIAAFFYQLGKRPLIPIYHHLVPQILEKSHGAH
jgi:hypothetical protein